MNHCRGFSRFLLCGAILSAGALFLWQGQAAAEGVRQGLALCARQLIPALFPLMLVSALLGESGCLPLLGRPLGLLLRPLGVSDSMAAIWLAGLVGGYLPCARLIAAATEKGQLTHRQGQALLPLAVIASPAFTVVGVGGQMLGSTALGWKLFFCQLAANLLTGLPGLTRLRPGTQPKAAAGQEAAPTAAALVTLLPQTAAATVGLCGFVCFFRAVTQAAAAVLPPKAAFLLFCLCEITSGCGAAAAAAQPALLCCCLLSLQSLSVLLQLSAFLPKGLSLRQFILLRPLHAAISTGLLWLWLRGDSAAPVWSAGYRQIQPRQGLPTGVFWCLLALLCLCGDFALSSLQCRAKKV